MPQLMQEKQGATFDFTTYFIFTFLVIIWGCAYWFMKQALHAYTPMQTASLRIAIASWVMLPFAIISFKKIDRRKWGWLVLSGFLGNGIPAYLYMLALTNVDSNIAGILNALTPIWVVFLGYLFFKKRISKQKLFGVLLGFMGLLILYVSKGKFGDSDLRYTVFILLATLMYGLNINLLEQKLRDVPSRYIGYSSLLVVGLLYSVLLVFGIDGKNIFTLDLWQPEFVYVLILGMVGTALSNILFFSLVKRSNANFASMVTYIMPFVSIIVGYIVGEAILWQSIVCFIMILLGVWLVKKAK